MVQESEEEENCGFIHFESAKGGGEEKTKFQLGRIEFFPFPCLVNTNLPVEIDLFIKR